MAIKIGVQLYTLRDLTEKDFEGTLREVSKLGYQGVELAGYGGLEAEQLRGLLEELGLQAAGSHVGIGRLIDSLDEEIAYNRAIGNNRLIIPWYDQTSWEEPSRLTDLIEHADRIGRACQEAGMELLYHNHAFEFRRDEEGNPMMDTLCGKLDKDVLKLELDACWAHHAGVDPAAYLRKHEGRIPLVHLKDMKKNEDGSALTVELGHGEVDLGAIVEAAAETGVQWLIVEQDVCQRPPLESISESMNWIKQYSEQGGSKHV